MEEEIKNEPTENTADASEFKIEDEAAEAPKKEKRSRKYDFYIELALFLVLGTLIGIAVKTEAQKSITIGFDDYKMKIFKQDYDINQLQADQDKQSAAAANQQPTDNSQPGGQTGPDQGVPSQDGSAPDDNSASPAPDNSVPDNSAPVSPVQGAPSQTPAPTNATNNGQ